MDAIDKLREEVLNDKYVKEFVSKNKLTIDQVDNNLGIFKIFKDNNEICMNCKGKKVCAMEDYLQRYHLRYNFGNISLVMKRCEFVDAINEDMLSYHFFPVNIPNDKLYVIESRKDVYLKINDYLKDPLNKNGLYIYGPFGTGKSFLLNNIALTLSKKNIKTAIVYYPDMVRFAKNNFGDSKLENLINDFKYVDVLMLDDIGGENNTPYIRDEILGPILQYRMVAKKPVFFTSNYSIEDLRKHMKETKEGIDDIKGDRIVERIRALTTEVMVGGENLRQKIDK